DLFCPGRSPLGWQEVSRRQSGVNSRRAFIAMSFDWGDDSDKKDSFLEAIKLGCKDCGYEADIVSADHTGYIMDRIISEIKQSRFVIADFTHNNCGAYFEAGFARGLNLPVIHTVMKGRTADLHFDIKQINYIEWSDIGELRRQISDRINAAIER
ncbi:MAG: hypothetical protein JST80_13520, partial [Bdellovibrionales bacterium]|nr:hypothetical protein [Bdellovibrionales bacterium]